jgi:hypothetical protein
VEAARSWNGELASDSRARTTLGNLSGGGVSERPKERASKAREVKASEGSNPSATARLIQLRRSRLRTGSLPRAVADERRNNKRRNADASEHFPHGLARPYAVTPVAWTYGSGGVRRSRSVRKYTERLIRASVAAAMAPTHQYQPPSVTAATIKPAASTNSVMASPSRHHRGNPDLTL